MSDPVDALVVDLLEWIGYAGRPYADVLDAWRTSCPRLPVWEEANRRGYVERNHAAGDPVQVVLTATGRARLATRLAPRRGGRMSPGRADATPALPS